MGLAVNVPKLELSATGIVALVGIAAGAYALWRVGGSIGDAFKWVGQKVQDVQTNISTHGEALKAGIAPQSEVMQTLTGRTYSNPLITNEGMSFDPLWFGLSA